MTLEKQKLAVCEKLPELIYRHPDGVDANLISLENFPHLHKKVVYADFAHKLERERDEARAIVGGMKEWCKAQRHLYDLAISNQESWMRKWDESQTELTLLRKVCDELASGLGQHTMKTPCSQCNKALTNYSNLPHVKAKG